MIDTKTAIRDWMFRALLFESEAESYRQAGIRLGADQRRIEEKLLESSISDFPLDIRNGAVRMARIYTLINCFENSVRELIKERLEDIHGIDWWEKGVPKKVQSFAASRKEAAEKETWLEGEKKNLLGFVNFGHLSDIVVNSWDDFSDLIPSQHWLKQRMEELEQTRNFIAHNRLLQNSEMRRIEMYISDWNKQVGV